MGNTYISSPLKNKTSLSKVLSTSIKIPSHFTGDFTKEAKIVEFEGLVIDFLPNILVLILGCVVVFALLDYVCSKY